MTASLLMVHHWSRLNESAWEQRSVSTPRTLESLQADLLRFETAGTGNLKVAKITTTSLANISLFPSIRYVQAHVYTVYMYMHVCTATLCTFYQVCPPGLHITLGIFYRIWCLLEADCHKLDLQLAISTSPTPTDRESFKKVSSLLKRHSQLTEKKLISHS